MEANPRKFKPKNEPGQTCETVPEQKVSQPKTHACSHGWINQLFLSQDNEMEQYDLEMNEYI